MNYSKFEGKLVGKTIEFVIYDIPNEIAEGLFTSIYGEGIRLEKIFNFYDKKSELSRLNVKRKMKVSNELLEVMKKALEYCGKTNGEYDISIGKQILERKAGKEVGKIGCSYEDIKIVGNEVILEHPDVLIDLGSIAKGYIVDKLIDFMKKQGIESGFIDARGDMFAFGKYEEIVNIQHPRDKDKIVGSIKLKNRGVATSGDYNQFHGSYEKSHIIKSKDLISVTVVADKVVDADVFASAVFLTEKEKREVLIKKRNEFQVFTVDRNLEEKEYNGFFDLRLTEKELIVK